MLAVAGHQYLLFPPVRPLAERFGAEFFRAVPEAPGVYLMSTARDGVLYVGKAKNLRRRLGSYRSGSGERLPPKVVRLLLCVERIDWDLCPDEAAALARERELIRALQPRFNRQGVRPPQEWFIGWSHDSATGQLSLGLWPADGEAGDDASPWDTAAEIHGPFVFARPAFAALLRQLWLETHPDATVVDLPSRLITGPVPTRWSVSWSDSLAPWLTQLRAFLESPPPEPTTTEESTPSPIVNIANIAHGKSGRAETSATLSFDAQWRALDAECLAEFQTRNRPALTNSLTH